jgi:hypothetical protein
MKQLNKTEDMTHESETLYRYQDKLHIRASTISKWRCVPLSRLSQSNIMLYFYFRVRVISVNLSVPAGCSSSLGFRHNPILLQANLKTKFPQTSINVAVTHNPRYFMQITAGWHSVGTRISPFHDSLLVLLLLLLW